MSGSQNWALDTPLNVATGGSVNYAGGGGIIQFRDGLDASRVMAGRMPQANQPDGYLGTVESRRQQRTMRAASESLARKSYDKGIHVGEKLTGGQYFWPQDMAFDSRLRAPATPGPNHTQFVERQVPPGTPTDRIVLWRDAQPVVDNLWKPSWL